MGSLAFPSSVWKPLAGKKALVTGGAKRIGKAIALALADAGADVAITYRHSADEAAATVRELAGFGVRSSGYACDLDQPAEIARAIGLAVSAHGGLDLLVNNAGAFASSRLEEITVAEWDAMFSSNTRGPFLMAQAAFPHLRAAGGRIVNVGSLGGLEAWATHGHYCSSKAALHMLSRTMAKAWAPEISVNCVAPGMIQQGEVEAAYRLFAERTPMQRNGSPADVAAAVLFFATAPHFITGQLLAVDGGLGL